MNKLLLLISIITLSFFSSLIGQEYPSIPDFNTAKSLISTRITENDSLRGNYQPDGVLKIYPPLWEVQLDTLYKDSFPKGHSRRTPLEETAVKWKWVERVSPNLLEGKRENSLFFDTEITSIAREKVRFFSSETFKIVETYKRIQHGRLEWVEDEFPEVKFDEHSAFKLIKDEEGIPIYIKVKAGTWTEWKKPTLKPSSRKAITTSQIQQALKERGYYDGPIDNVLDKEVRAALIQFQKDKNIPICNSMGNMSSLFYALGFTKAEINGF